MIFCNNCFEDQEVKDVITGLNNISECPTCGTNNVFIYDTFINDELTTMFQALIEIYTPLSLLPKNYPRENIQLLKDELKQNWNIFNSEISNNNIYRILTSICSDLYHDEPSLFDSPIGIAELHNEKYIKTNSIVKANTWSKFVECIKYENRFHTNCLQPEVLDDFFDLSQITYKKGDIFYRARISSKKGYNVSEIGSPEKEKVLSGRANSEGIRCLYLANKIKTAIHEVRAGIFDYVTIGRFKLKDDIKIVDLTQIDKISPFKEKMDLTKYAINREVLSKINKEMSKSFNRKESTLNYVPTQYICDYIKSIVETTSNGNKYKYSGIKYSSTTDSSGYNLAIFYPELFECTGTEVHNIKSLQYEINLITH